MRIPVTDVAAAIVRRQDGRVLLAERTPRQTGAGLWELPGGKIEVGESAVQAAARELAEEVGVVAVRLRPAIRYEHAYRTRRLRMHFFQVEEWSGIAEGREGQRLAWVDPFHPDVRPLQPSNERILRALALPDLYVDCRPQAGEDLSAQFTALHRALAAGARLLRIGGRRLSPDQRVALARRVQGHAEGYRAKLMLDGGMAEILRAGMLGLHTSTRQLHCMPTRPAVAFWIASCYDENDLAHAAAAGADAAVVSPVLGGETTAERTPLGWERFARLAEQSSIPVYAQGGLRPELRATALAHGAIGVACPMPMDMIIGERHPLTGQ